MRLSVIRVYDEPASPDGFRVLVDRLWPRGVSKERAAIDLWAKDAAPSAALRTAFHRDGLPWDAFVDAYRAELASGTGLTQLRNALAGHDAVALVTATRDREQNHALVLRDALEA